MTAVDQARAAWYRFARRVELIAGTCLFLLLWTFYSGIATVRLWLGLNPDWEDD